MPYILSLLASLSFAFLYYDVVFDSYFVSVTLTYQITVQRPLCCFLLSPYAFNVSRLEC